ncbi:hypothetical protein DWX23_04745 [Parabacteroides sp. AF18-52]|jgi:hypothetical protein|nr:hypothetical protein DWX23_04745 [Parabacteroides sp. AF18-52]
MFSHKYILFLIIPVFIIYFPILENDFLDFWDDQWVVMNQYTERGINLDNIWAILTDFYHGQYAPFNEYLYLLLFNIAGYNPCIFHLASILIHYINVYLVFIILRQLLISSNRVDMKNVNLISFLTTLLFAIHPFNVESVAWMSASKVLVYALFYLLATYTFLLYLKNNRFIFYIFTLILFFFSFWGKEQAVTFPVWLFLILLFLNKQKAWHLLVPFLFLSFWFGITTMISQGVNGEGVLTENTTYSFGQRFVYACYSFFEYLFKSIFPIKLSYLYPFPSQVGESLPVWLLTYPLLLLILFVAFRKQLSRWPIALGLLIFTIHIIIALHIIPLSRYAVVADRYAYISTIGICFIISYYSVKHLNNKLICCLLVIYILYMGIYANQRSYVWQNTDTLKQELRSLLQQRENYDIEYNRTFGRPFSK